MRIWSQTSSLNLKPADTVLPGCDVFWQRRANQFVGFMDPMHAVCLAEDRRTDDL